MSCGLCDNPAEEVEVRDEHGARISVSICNDCLLDSDNSFMIVNFFQSKFDNILDGQSARYV